MSIDEERNNVVKFLNVLKIKKKDYPAFEESLSTLQNYAATKGLMDEDINLLVNIIINTDLSATKLVSLAKCLIPQYKISEHAVKSIISWCLSSINKLPISVSIIIMQWIIGSILDHQLIDKKERQIARIIYVLTKPEDVTRRNISRLLTLHQKYSKPQKHIIVLLSLFKSYKPELVPEKIQSINTESVWKPIPEGLRLMFQDAKTRLEIQQTQDLHLEYFNWNTFESKKTKKTVTSLLPSVGYFQIGSSIFKEKNKKSIFDISSIEELGKLQLSIELPCNAISLLSNTAGYHLLTFSNFQYQSRFSYNLYNTLIRAFMLENEKFSMEEINKLLDMTIEFSRYMQQDIPVVNHFLGEYLYFNTGEYQSKLLMLLQWMTSLSISDLQEKILVHVQNMFYESSLMIKCEIIKTLKILITNLINIKVNINKKNNIITNKIVELNQPLKHFFQGFKECCHKTPAPFLGQSAMDNLEEVIPILTKISEELIISEALSFYEEICILENQSTILFFTLAPSAVIYGAFITKHLAILSKICKLLLSSTFIHRYRDRSLQLKTPKLQKLFKKKIYTISIYAQEIVEALWYDELFKNHKNKYFLKDIPVDIIEDLEDCNINCLLNISNHYSVLPYKYTLSKTGLNISTKEIIKSSFKNNHDAMSIALHYYPTINEFLSIFQN
ncbi:Centromere protein I [Apis cerana cerana]|uniref:Centromere protein I n=1 Tax=Apis cerana cerana TaxID=94128 RepID=A0A2A3EBS8_APICC|nr:Centromere protein I [Apis cerana cerana]